MKKKNIIHFLFFLDEKYDGFGICYRFSEPLFGRFSKGECLILKSLKTGKYMELDSSLNISSLKLNHNI